MAGYRRKVRQWQDAGLITAAQADSIFDWEKSRKAGKFGRGLLALGLFAILMGVVSIIAANWYVIPGAVKIAVHLILNGIVAGVAWHAVKAGKPMLREGAAIGFFVLTLTLMVLIGQVFQLDGTLGGLTATWMIITLPFMWFFGHDRLSAVPWMIGFIATVIAVMADYLQPLPDYWEMFFVVAVITLLPLALMADGSLKIFHRAKPAYAEIFVRTGAFLLGLSATLSTFYWSASRSGEIVRAAHDAGLDALTAYLYLAAVFAVAVAGVALRSVLGRFFMDSPVRRMEIFFAITSVIVIALPVLMPTDESSFAAALAFILYWIFIGWVGQQLAWSRLISLAIILVAIRIFAIYIEVFGDMLSTGIGLIVGGAVMIALIALARKMNKHLTLTPGKGSLHG